MDILKNRNSPIGLVIIIFLALIALDQFGYLTPIRSVIQTLVQPFQTSLSIPAAQAGTITQGAKTRNQLEEENASLRAELDRLLIENIQLQEVERENKQLRDLVNYVRNNPTLDYEAASVKGRVIGADLSNLLFTVFIDVGARDGIAKDMPVITERGLVGRIAQVFPNSSQVLLLIDPASSVNAVIQNSRVEGLVRGEVGGTLIMDRIPQGETVSPGDLVLTSGLGGNFPDKLVIGQIIEVSQQDLDLFQTARVRSTVDFGQMETILVLTGFQASGLESILPEVGQ